jgi:hypothetical protein
MPGAQPASGEAGTGSQALSDKRGVMWKYLVVLRIVPILGWSLGAGDSHTRCSALREDSGKEKAGPKGGYLVFRSTTLATYNWTVLACLSSLITASLNFPCSNAYSPVFPFLYLIVCIIYKAVYMFLFYTLLWGIDVFASFSV